MKKTNHTFRLIALAFLLACGAAVLAMEHQRVNIKPQLPSSKTKTQPDVVPSYDPALIKKMIMASRSLDFNRPECTYSGDVDLTDLNDTLNSLHHIHFQFCRSGDQYYYHLANVEIIHEGNLNVFIQNDQRKVVVSNERIAIRPPVNGLDSIMKALSGESYALKNIIKGKNQTLSLVNERHLSCKEFAVTLDTVTGKLEHIHARLSDFGSPKDKGLDRLMDVSISGISYHADREQFPLIRDVIHKGKDRWLLTDKYKSYELIML